MAVRRPVRGISIVPTSDVASDAPSSGGATGVGSGAASGVDSGAASGVGGGAGVVAMVVGGDVEDGVAGTVAAVLATGCVVVDVDGAAWRNAGAARVVAGAASPS